MIIAGKNSQAKVIFCDHTLTPQTYITNDLTEFEIGEDAVIVTVFSDDNKKYLSTDLLREEPVKDGFLSPDVELTSFRAIKRVCSLCCNPEECEESKFLCDHPECKLPGCPARN